MILFALFPAPARPPTPLLSGCPCARRTPTPHGGADVEMACNPLTYFFPCCLPLFEPYPSDPSVFTPHCFNAPRHASTAEGAQRAPTVARGAGGRVIGVLAKPRNRCLGQDCSRQQDCTGLLCCGVAATAAAANPSRQVPQRRIYAVPRATWRFIRPARTCAKPSAQEAVRSATTPAPRVSVPCASLLRVSMIAWAARFTHHRAPCSLPPTAAAAARSRLTRLSALCPTCRD